LNGNKKPRNTGEYVDTGYDDTPDIGSENYDATRYRSRSAHPDTKPNNVRKVTPGLTKANMEATIPSAKGKPGLKTQAKPPLS